MDEVLDWLEYVSQLKLVLEDHDVDVEELDDSIRTEYGCALPFDSEVLQ